MRPLQITHCRIQTNATSEIEGTILSREDFFRLANKSADGTPTQIYYSPALASGKLYIYPEASDERVYLNLTAQIPIEDFDAASNNPDFPAEWHDALVWNLAKRQITEYGITDPSTIQMILGIAEETYRMAAEFDAEDTSLMFIPDFTYFA